MQSIETRQGDTSGLASYPLYWRVVDVIADAITFTILFFMVPVMMLLGMRPLMALVVVAGSYAMSNQFNREYEIEKQA